jgi:hypothetical protein
LRSAKRQLLPPQTPTPRRYGASLPPHAERGRGCLWRSNCGVLPGTPNLEQQTTGNDTIAKIPQQLLQAFRPSSLESRPGRERRETALPLVRSFPPFGRERLSYNWSVAPQAPHLALRQIQHLAAGANRPCLLIEAFTRFLRARVLGCRAEPGLLQALSSGWISPTFRA